MTNTQSRYRRELQFWAVHCFFIVLPSFLIAGTFLGLLDSLAHVLAMVAGVLPFLFGFAALTTFAKPFQDRQHLLPRALRTALLFRIGFVLFFGFLSLGSPIFLIAIPDVWAGFGAVSIVGWASEQSGGVGIFSASSLPPHLIFLCTLLEGIFLSFLLSLLTFFILLILTRNQAHKWQVTIPESGLVPLEKLMNSTPHLIIPTPAEKSSSLDSAVQDGGSDSTSFLNFPKSELTTKQSS